MYAQNVRTARISRVTGAIFAAALQLAIVVLVWTGFSPRMVQNGVQSALTALDLRNPPPSPIKPPPRHPAHAASGRAAPAHLRSHAAAIVAPPVPALKPPPVPVAVIAGVGVQTAAGAAPIPGPGSGAGGNGQGTGSGSSGNGEGDGGRDVELVRGRFKDADIPEAMRNAAFSGTTRVEVGVSARGQVMACRTIRSSGNSRLDILTCQVIFQRFRFRPALDAQGRPVPDKIIYDQDWSITGQFGNDRPDQ